MQPNDRVRPSTRAQSETVGSVLVLALVVILVSTVGAAGIAVLDTFGDERVAATVAVEGVVDEGAGELRVVVIHEGGDPLEPADVVLLFRTDGDRERSTLANATGNGTTFRTAHRRTVTDPTFDPDDRVRVVAIHGPTGKTLAEATVARPTPP